MSLSLDRVVLRCLEQAPSDRFASYQELREALSPLSSVAPIPASPGNRVLANLIDWAVLMIIALPLSFLNIAHASPIFGRDPFPGMSITLYSALGILLQWLYFALCDWRFGKTLGKH